MNAIMTDFDRHRTGTPLPGDWQGFAEIDQAIRQRREANLALKRSQNETCPITPLLIRAERPET